MQDVSKNTFSFSSNYHGETLPSLVNNVSNNEVKDTSARHEFLAVREAILNKKKAVWVPPKDEPLEKRPLPKRACLISQNDKLEREAKRIERRVRPLPPTPPRKAHSNPTSPIKNKESHAMSQRRPLPKTPDAKKACSNPTSPILSNREEQRKLNQNRPLPKTPENKADTDSLVIAPVDSGSETVAIPLAHADSFVKRSFQKLVDFAKRVLRAVSQLLFNMCDGFKKISMICIGPFTFRRKEKPAKEETSLDSTKSPSEISHDSKIPPAPTGPSMAPPPPPHPVRLSSWSQDLKIEMDKFEEEFNLDAHTLKRKKEEKPQEIQDSVSLINKSVEERRAAFIDEEELEESDDDWFEWEFEFNPFGSNDSDVRIVAEDEKTKTIADVSINLSKGEATVKTYSKLGKKQQGTAAAITSENLNIQLRKVEKKGEGSKKETTPASHPFGKDFFKKVEFSDLTSDEDNSDWEDEDDDYEV